jgi:hypothetical protein
VSIVVEANNAPDAIGESYSTGFGKALIVNGVLGLLANDSDPDNDPISVTGFAIAENGDFRVSADGSFTYTPNAGFSGTETLFYRVSDGFAETEATVSIVVEADEFEFNEVVATPNQPFLRGGAGADALIFNTTRSTQAFGGAGADVFVFDLSNDGKRDVGYIRDFEQGVDLLDLGGTAFALRHIGPNTVISMAGADRDTLTISGVNLTESDFTTVWTSRDDGSMI